MSHETRGWRGVSSGLVLAALAALSASAAPPGTRPAEGIRGKTPAVYALTGLRIVSAPGAVVPSGTLIVRDGALEAVGKDAPIPADARVVDLSGKTAYPGFLDAYATQSAAWDPSRGAPYWNGNIRPQLSMAELHRSDERLNEQLRRQGIVARLVAPDAGIVRGTSALVTTGPADSESPVLAARVAQHITLTVPFARGDAHAYPTSPMGAVALARQAMLDAEWYATATAAHHAGLTGRRPERNDALETLSGWTRESRLVVFDTANEQSCLRAATFAKEFSLRAALLGSGNEYKRLDAIRALGLPILVPIDFPKPPNVSTPESARNASFESLMHWDHAPENAARLAAAGIPIAFTTSGLPDPGGFLAGVRKAVERGLSPDAALRALTTTPAELYGVSDRLGALEPGKRADLVIANGDLFDPNAAAEITETWIEGRRFEWDPPPSIDARGVWNVTWTTDGQTRAARIDVTGAKTLAGTLVLPAEGDKAEARIGFARLAIEDGRLAGHFPAKDLGQEGLARLSAVVLAPAESGGAATWTGTIAWPTGASSTLAASRDAPASDALNAAPSSSPPKGPPEPRRALFPLSYPLVAYGRPSPPDAPRRVLFTNATVWTCGPRGVLSGASLLIGEGKIIAVGADLETPPGAVVVDAKGRHITPGLIDCHSHMATDGGINETGQAITAEVRIGDFLDARDITIHRQLAGGVTSANVLHGSANPIGGQNQVIKLRWGALPDELRFAEAPAGIKFALGENVKQSNAPNETSRYPQTRMGVEQLLNDAFQAAREYRQARDAWAKDPRGGPPRRDLELEAISEVLEGTRWVHCHSYRQDEILALLRTCESFGIRIGTLQHILEGYKVADPIAKHGAMASSFSDWWAYKFEVYDAIPFNGALMHRAGVVVSFNSDDRELARHLNHEAAKAVKYGGVPPDEALKFVTLNPARQLRVDGFVGSLEPGKHADFVVWNDAPLSTRSRCEQTWIDGRKYFDREECAQMRTEIESRRAALVRRILDSGESPRKPGEGRSDPSELWPRDDLFCHPHAEHDEGHVHDGSNDGN